MWLGERTFPPMTIAVDLGCKATKQIQSIPFITHLIMVIHQLSANAHQFSAENAIERRISIEFRNPAHQLSANILGSYLWGYL